MCWTEKEIWFVGNCEEKTEGVITEVGNRHVCFLLVMGTKIVHVWLHVDKMFVQKGSSFTAHEKSWSFK